MESDKSSIPGLTPGMVVTRFDTDTPASFVVPGGKGSLAEFFQNTAGQFSVDELGKILAVVAALFLGVAFFFTHWIPDEARGYFMPVEVALLSYAFAQGAIGNVTKQ